MLLAQVDVGQGQSLADVTVSRTRDRNASRLSETLQPGRDVHTVTKEVSSSNHDVANVDADPELKASAIEHPGARFCQLLLHRHCALNRIHGAREFGQHAVASGVGDPAPVVSNQ